MMEWMVEDEAATSRVIDRLVSLLVEQPKVVAGSQVQVLALARDLNHLSAFLPDAEAKSGHSKAVKDWIKQVKEVAELVEDIVDLHVLKVSQREVVSFLGRAGQLVSTSSSRHVNSHDDLASDLQNVKESLEKIRKKGQRLNLRIDRPLRSRTRAVNRIFPGTVSEDLALRFNDLPFRLKMCFLYFSIFPAESLISNEKLIKLWIAEDFIQEEEGVTLEKVAETYLKKLIRRNMVEACEGFYGVENFCRVDGLMHNMARQMADQLCFCHIRDVRTPNFIGKSRRLSISNSVSENVLETIGDSQVRYVFVYKIDTLNHTFLVTLFEKYKLLTLLDFEYVQLDRVPEEVGNLFFLKYFSLKNTKVKVLPKSVGKLLNLQTLDLRNTQLTDLPIEIGKLQNLRHLLASGYENKIGLDSIRGVRIKEGIGRLVNLQTLMIVDGCLCGMDVIQELKKLKQLRSLSISRLTAELGRALCACIEEMNHLESLSLHMINDEIMDLESVSSVPRNLERLVLKGSLKCFPYWISRLSKLSVLCLISLSALSDDPVQYLCHLPNLMSMWLYNAYDGEKLQFCEDDFPNLKLLALREMQRLESVEIEEGALPFLEELRIGPSQLLDEVPSGIQHLRTLKVASFYDMPDEFVRNMQPDGGSEYQKVKHVPSVLFWYGVEGRRFISYVNGERSLLNHLQGFPATNVRGVNEDEPRLSFSYGDVEEDDEVDRFSSSSDQNIVPQWSRNSSTGHFSFSSGFYTDDFED